MKRSYLIFMLCATMTAAIFTACTDSIDNPIGKSETQTPGTDPELTTDQLSVLVTADLPTAILSKFDSNSSATALIHRLPETTSEIDIDTRMVLLKGSDFEAGSPFSKEQMEDMVWAYLNWGYIAIERPTEKQLNNFTKTFMDAATTVQEWLLAETFDMDEEEAKAAAKSCSQSDRMQARLANVRSYARRAGVDDDENEVVGEMLIYGPEEYFYQEPFQTEHYITTQSQDGDGELSEPVKQTFKIERNDYYNGLLADAVAQWLNDAEKRLDEEWSENEAPARQFNHRASGTDAINKLISASETFTFNGSIEGRNANNEVHQGFYRILMTIRSWGIHNFSTNKDYYYVQQMTSLNMSKTKNLGQLFYPTEDENTWLEAKGYGQNNYWNMWYGSFLSEYTTSMKLDGGGTILLEAATPETENGATTTTVNIGESSSATTTVGITGNFTGGISGGKPTATGSIGGSWSEGVTNGTSFSMGSSRAYKDIRPVKNREFNQVTWTYKANKPKFRRENRDKKYIYYMHDTAGDILTNTADLTNEACWSVANPVGRYTLYITSHPQTAALLYHHDKDDDKTSKQGHYEYTNCDMQNNFSHQFLQPNRTQQKWTMSVTVDEVEGYKLPGQGAALEKRIMEKYPQQFKQEFTLADKNNTSLEAAIGFIRYGKSIFAEQYEILQDMGKDQGIKKFTIVWRRQGSTAKETFTVTLGDNENKLVADGGADDGKNIIDHLFDGNMKTKWMSTSDQKVTTANGTHWYVEFHAPAPVSPTSYTIIADNSATQKGYNPAWWKLYGKKEKTDKWTELAHVDDRYSSGSMPWANCTTKAKNFDKNPEDMQYYRLEIYRSWNTSVQLAEFYFNYPTE